MYAIMSDTSARARRRPFWFGSLFRKGLIALLPLAGVPRGAAGAAGALGGVATGAGSAFTAGMFVVGRVAGNADEMVAGRAGAAAGGAGGALAGRAGAAGGLAGGAAGLTAGGGGAGRVPERTGVGITGRAGGADGGAGGVAGRAAGAFVPPTDAAGGRGGGLSVGRCWVERGGGGPPAPPGAGGAGGTAGMRAPGIGGVILDSDGRGGTMGGRGGTGVADLGTAGCETRGVSSDDRGTSPEGRGALMTTPGVKVGVGFRRCGGAVNGSR